MDKIGFDQFFYKNKWVYLFQRRWEERKKRWIGFSILFLFFAFFLFLKWCFLFHELRCLAESKRIIMKCRFWQIRDWSSDDKTVATAECGAFCSVLIKLSQMKRYIACTFLDDQEVYAIKLPTKCLIKLLVFILYFFQSFFFTFYQTQS